MQKMGPVSEAKRILNNTANGPHPTDTLLVRRTDLPLWRRPPWREWEIGNSFSFIANRVITPSTLLALPLSLSPLSHSRKYSFMEIYKKAGTRPFTRPSDVNLNPDVVVTWQTRCWCETWITYIYICQLKQTVIPVTFAAMIQLASTALQTQWTSRGANGCLSSQGIVILSDLFWNRSFVIMDIIVFSYVTLCSLV